jgi:hypothetical protein
MSKYIGLIREEFSEENDWEVGYNITKDLKSILEWKTEMLKCINIVDCKVLKIKEINHEQNTTN